MSLTLAFWTILGITVLFFTTGIVLISRISARNNAAEEAEQDRQLEHELASGLRKPLNYYVLWLNAERKAAA